MSLLSPETSSIGKLVAYTVQPRIRIVKAEWKNRVPTGKLIGYAVTEYEISNLPDNGVDLYIYAMNDTSSPGSFYYDHTLVDNTRVVYYRKNIPNDGDWHLVGKISNYKPYTGNTGFATFVGRFNIAGTYTLGIGFTVMRPGLGIAPPSRPAVSLFPSPIHVTVPAWVRNYALPFILGLGAAVGGYYLYEKIIRKKI